MGAGRGSLVNQRGGGPGHWAVGRGLASCRPWSGGRAMARVRGHHASFPQRSRPGLGWAGAGRGGWFLLRLGSGDAEKGWEGLG